MQFHNIRFKVEWIWCKWRQFFVCTVCARIIFRLRSRNFLGFCMITMLAHADPSDSIPPLVPPTQTASNDIIPRTNSYPRRRMIRTLRSRCNKNKAKCSNNTVTTACSNKTGTNNLPLCMRIRTCCQGSEIWLGRWMFCFGYFRCNRCCLLLAIRVCRWVFPFFSGTNITCLPARERCLLSSWGSVCL